MKKNEKLSSKVDFVVKENDSLKNKIISISNDLDVCLKKNESLQNNINSHVCHATITSSSSVSLHAPLLLQSLRMIFVLWKRL